MDAGTGYTDGMTQREPEGGALVRAVAYVRVSSEEQRRHGYSLDDQERELRIQIGLKRWELVEVVRDEGLSGADPSRPGLRRIEDLAQEGKMDVALATKRNRWFRDIEHRRRYERGLRRHGARIAALNDSGNAIADGVDDLLGEEQRREIARETLRGRRARARKGEVVAGVVPFGYRFTPDRKNFKVEEARRRVLANRAPSKASRRFWELSGVLYCPCGRRMGTHTAKRRAGHHFYYVCGLRRSNQGRCEYGVKFQRAGETEEKVRALVLGFLSRPEEVRRRAEVYVEAERSRTEGAKRDLAGREGRLRKLQERRGALIDLAADGAITREDLKVRLSTLDGEREGLRREFEEARNAEEEAERHRELPTLAESLARDLPYLLEKAPLVREYETVPEEGKVGNWLGIYKIAPDRIRRLPDEEVEWRRRQAEDERAARYRAVYDDLGLRMVAHPDGTLEASWKFGAALLRNSSDKSKHKHASRHFHATEHPLVQSFQPDEDWIWCHVDEVVMESAS